MEKRCITICDDSISLLSSRDAAYHYPLHASKKMKDIFNEIARSLNEIINKDYSESLLEIKRLEGNVGFTGYFIDKEGKKEWLNIFDFTLNSNIIHELYKKTQNHSLTHKNWNRAKFKLYSNQKYEIEYIWDQELQDKVDKHNTKKYHT